ncbi:MAG: HyaD/HybD family hydrogenase maturation endopeptidase [Deltaproteobacteria bacterium]|nr:HyaD/HybD family hydrogenase maturation endopeptidase [Deltaproteobacteria bacterium]
MSPNRTASNSNCPESAKNEDSKDSGQSFFNVLVLGLGNILLSDEGVGVKAVEELQNRYDCSDAVEIVDGGTMGIELLPYFEERSHILIIDAVKSGCEPGTITRIEDPPAYFSSKTSPHQIGLADVMGVAVITDIMPQNITLFGIEPKQFSTGLSLSTEVARNLSRLVDLVIAELKIIGIKVQAKENRFSFNP